MHSKAKLIGMLLAIGFLILIYMSSLVMSLFGPSWGRLLGVPAFLGTLLLLGVLQSERRRGTFGYFIDSNRRVSQHLWGLRTMIVFGIVACVGSMLTSFLVAWNLGVADGRRPVFEVQPVYSLCNHGVYTPVSRARYLVVGSSSVVAWHAFGVAILLFALHLVLCGKLPWRPEAKQPLSEEYPSKMNQ